MKEHSKIENSEGGDCGVDTGREVFMEVAWRDFMDWATRAPEVLAQYKEETGKTFGLAGRAPSSPIEAMIDKACGYEGETLRHEEAMDFIIWATEALWGIEEAPEALRREIAARKQSPLQSSELLQSDKPIQMIKVEGE